MIEIEQLLQPIAGSDPSGADPEEDSRFEAIRAAIESGTEEAPPEWKKLRKQTLDLLNDGRSLDLLVFLSVTLVVTDGYQGLRDGLVILQRSLKEHWDSIYPKLDESEPEDERFIIRLNTIAQLGEQPRKVGDPLGYIEKILRAPLSATSGRNVPAFWAVWEVSQGSGDAGASATVRDALLRAEPADRDALRTLVAESIEAVKAINSDLIDKVGSEFNAPFDEFLLPTLEGILKFIDGSATAGGTSEASEAETVAAPASGGAAPAAKAAVSVADGAIRSSEDVRRALDKIIDFYRKSEPSSPVPYLLKRAKKLVDADFMAIVANLHKDAEFQFRTNLDITEDND